ncbi:hypothetical protein C8J57DRAFT_1517175 [Mycena rebaudengoi]|nr:hypothetical protein C8J57DRAFT_1517175 [Mycena rebaudengoi]
MAIVRWWCAIPDSQFSRLARPALRLRRCLSARRIPAADVADRRRCIPTPARILLYMNAPWRPAFTVASMGCTAASTRCRVPWSRRRARDGAMLHDGMTVPRRAHRVSCGFFPPTTAQHPGDTRILWYNPQRPFCEKYSNLDDGSARPTRPLFRVLRVRPIPPPRGMTTTCLAIRFRSAFMTPSIFKTSPLVGASALELARQMTTRCDL